MKIYGHPLSPCTRKVLVTLAEKELPAELVAIDLFAGAHQKEAHLALQPFGVVPVLDDDGFILYESRAIMRYLDARSGSTSLTPSSAKDAARMAQWLSVDQSYVAPHTRTLAVERVMKQHQGKAQDAAATEAAESALGTAFAVLERALTSAPYLAGENVSLADLSLIPYVAALPLLGASHLLAGLPKLESWRQRMEARPSWRAASQSA